MAALVVLGIAAVLAIMLVWQITWAQEELSYSWSNGSAAKPTPTPAGTRTEALTRYLQGTPQSGTKVSNPPSSSQLRVGANLLVGRMRQAGSQQELEALLSDAADLEEKMEAAGQTTDRARFRNEWVVAAKASIRRRIFAGDTDAFDNTMAEVGQRQHGTAFSENVIAAKGDPTWVVLLLIETARLQATEGSLRQPLRSAATTADAPPRHNVGGMTEPRAEEQDDPVIARLQRIERLLSSGVISQDEYDDKRREILSDL